MYDLGLPYSANEGAWLRLGGTDGDSDIDCFDDPDGAIIGEILVALESLGFDDPLGTEDGDRDTDGLDEMERYLNQYLGIRETWLRASA
jgi:hypothetical protein